MTVKLESLFSELHSVLAEEGDDGNLIHAATSFAASLITRSLVCRSNSKARS